MKDNLKSNNPIGIFDSGIGGLTVARAIHNLLPYENFIYFGDTAHLPYGDKSVNAIKSWSKSISQFLLDKHCKMIVIACNTASAIAFSTVKKFVDHRALTSDVINPTANYVSDKYKKGKIAVIGTKGTIQSRVYVKQIQKRNPELVVTQQATPLLAPMIEEGYFNNNISRTIINSYLDKKNFIKIEALILGCTHYPLIKKEVLNFYKNKVEVIDSAEIVANSVQTTLKQKHLLKKTGASRHSFYVSDYTEAFDQSTKIFFGENVVLKKAAIW